MKVSKIISALAVLAFATVASAADEGFKISGDLATSIFFEDGKGANAVNGVQVGQGSPGSPLSGNANGDFSVDLLEINLEKALGNSSFALGIGYGRMMGYINSTISGAVPKDSLNLTNAYFQHKVGDTGVWFKLGKFESGMGYESYNYMDNMNYTRGFAFTQTMPWYFTGLHVGYTHEMFDIGVTLANSTQNTDLDENRSKVAVVHASVKPMENLGIKVNYLMGQQGDGFAALEDLSILNAIVTYDHQMFTAAFEYVMRTEEEAIATPATEDTWNTMALYLGYKMENMGVGLRYEMLNSEFAPAADADNDAVTLTGYWDPDQNARVKLEIGMHNGEANTFTKGGNPPTAEDGMMFYGLGVMYRF